MKVANLLFTLLGLSLLQQVYSQAIKLDCSAGTADIDWQLACLNLDCPW